MKCIKFWQATKISQGAKISHRAKFPQGAKVAPVFVIFFALLTSV